MKGRRVYNYEGYKKDQSWNKLIKNTPTLSASELWKHSDALWREAVVREKAERAKKREMRLAREAENELLNSAAQMETSGAT